MIRDGKRCLAGQGYIIDYLLYANNGQPPIPCELYVGTIGHRGNPKSVLSDETSRFMQFAIGMERERVTTQYGFHKYRIKVPSSIPMQNRE